MPDVDDEFRRKLGSVGDALITELAKHKRQKNALLSAYHPLKERIVFTSWRDDTLPLYSWAALAVGLLPRERYLPLFRAVAERVKHRHDTVGDAIFVNHLSLKDTTNKQFDLIFEPLLSDGALRRKFGELAIWPAPGLDDTRLS